ncbi:hypothetical protein GOP47_0012139 [Adiantum capillus-veneris]|uniref:Methyltransferase small domain-containing protein n=1 Tax=Adiantum capillus-veneris TaxID=13818 RepID=A0A9D4URH2_ADICA|nr:hypothetical protein GOP47_0012139 [Adiantum capillus-veneris]
MDNLIVCLIEAKDTTTVHSKIVLTSALFFAPSPRTRIAEVRLVGRHPEVYEPCDDSFALVDALLADKAQLEELKPSLCLEVGCGSGYVITSLALILGNCSNSEVQFLATDVSEAAVHTTCSTLAAHHVNAEVVVADLVSGLEKRLDKVVDVLVFNPPYVPTPEHEVGVEGIASAWAGGDRGRMVIDRMLSIIDSLLSSKGIFYLVAVTENNPGEICQVMRCKGFASRIVVQRHTDEESLHVLKFWRVDDPLDQEGPTTPSVSPRTSSLHRTFSQRLARLVSFK